MMTYGTGDLVETFVKSGSSSNSGGGTSPVTITRRLHPSSRGPYTAPGSQHTFSVPGRSLLLVRNVGHHMHTDCGVRLMSGHGARAGGKVVPEGIVDAFVTILGGMQDILQVS